MKPAIEIKNLTVVYNESTPNETIVFNDYSVEFEKGNINVITGGNGTGKSTLLNVLLGTVHIKSGKIIVEGVDITKWSSLKRTRLFGAVHQDTMLGTCPNLTIQENFQLTNSKRWWLPFLYRRSLTEKQKHSIKQTGLPLATRGAVKINTLSGGQRQAVAACLAVENDKPILLFDEFTSALDEEAEQNVLKYTIDLAVINNITVLMVMHNANIMKKYTGHFINL